MDFDFDLFPKRGRPPKPVEVNVLRSATEADLESLRVPLAAEVPELKRISERHHALARALAAGLSVVEAAALVGYTPENVRVLRQSPAFLELQELYREKADAEFAELGSRIAGLAKDAIVLLQDRLEDEPEKVSTGQLIELTKLGADRSGFGPSQKTEVNINVELGARLAAARERARASLARDITPEE